jgi:phosphoglycolate phosphatase
VTYDALLFDNDGVLLERTLEDRYALEGAVRDAFREHGVVAPEEDHVADLVYGVTECRLRSVCDTYGMEVEAFWRSRDVACSRAQRAAIRAGRTGLYPDVEALDGLDRPSGVVSTNQQATLAFAYDWLDAPAFDVVRGRPPTVESLRRKKPNPYYLREALDALGAERALYIGDSAHDVVAARTAGIDAAFLRRAHNQDVSLPVTPAQELTSLHDLSGVLQ